MGITSFFEQEEMLKLSKKLLTVEEERIAGEQGFSIEQLEKILNDVIKNVEYIKKPETQRIVVINTTVLFVYIMYIY